MVDCRSLINNRLQVRLHDSSKLLIYNDVDVGIGFKSTLTIGKKFWTSNTVFANKKSAHIEVAKSAWRDIEPLDDESALRNYLGLDGGNKVGEVTVLRNGLRIISLELNNVDNTNSTKGFLQDLSRKRVADIHSILNVVEIEMCKIGLYDVV